jgi:hypothetical protein
MTVRCLPIAFVLLMSSEAWANSDEVCFGAAEKGQRLERENKLMEAKDRFIECGRTDCPSVVSSTCASFLRRVEEEIPTLVVEAKDAQGRSVTMGTLLIDGKLSPDAFSGRAIPLDPGTHEVHLTVPGRIDDRKTILLNQHEKGTRLTFNEAPVPQADTRSPTLPVGGLLVGGVGLAALVPGVFFWVSGDAQRRAFGCNTTAGCTSAEASSVRTKLILGDVFIGVAATGVVVGALWLLLGRTRTTQPRLGAAVEGYRF